MERKIGQYRAQVEELIRKAALEKDDRARQEHLEMAGIYRARADLLDFGRTDQTS